MYIYPVEKLFKKMAAYSMDNLSSETKIFIDLYTKEQKTEDEQKSIDKFVYKYSKEEWELYEYMIKKGIYN